MLHSCAYPLLILVNRRFTLNGPQLTSIKAPQPGPRKNFIEIGKWVPPRVQKLK